MVPLFSLTSYTMSSVTLTGGAFENSGDSFFTVVTDCVVAVVVVVTFVCCS